MNGLTLNGWVQLVLLEPVSDHIDAINLWRVRILRFLPFGEVSFGTLNSRKPTEIAILKFCYYKG